MSNTTTGAAAGATHVTDGPLTTSLTAKKAPGLLLSAIDSRIVKIRPSATPLDQISRLANVRQAKSMTVKYYSVDTRDSATTVVTAPTTRDKSPVAITVAKPGIFAASETLLFPDIPGDDGQALVAYVTSVDTEGQPTIMPVNAGALGGLSGTRVVRMGRAAAELDVQTPTYEALPIAAENFCQIFKAQIEESTLHRMTNKEVGWTFSDNEEVAIMDMRMGMERSFLFGVKGVIDDPVKHQDVLLTRGIWSQTDNEFTYDPSARPDEEFIVKLTRQAFGGHAGSRRKILLAGSDLIEALNRLEHTRVIGASEVVTRWGIDFSEIRSKFGSLYVLHDEVFDNCGMPGNGMVVDPQYLTKYAFIPMAAERLDLKRSGQRNTEAVVVTEASCLVLRYPKTHMRVVASTPEGD